MHRLKQFTFYFLYAGRTTYSKLDFNKINDQIKNQLNPEKFYLAVEDLGLCITSSDTSLTGLDSRGYAACYEEEEEVLEQRNNKNTTKANKNRNFEFFYNKSSFFVKNSHGKCLQGRPNTIPCGAFDEKSSNFDAEPVLRNYKPEISEFVVDNYLATFEDCNIHLHNRNRIYFEHTSFRSSFSFLFLD